MTSLFGGGDSLDNPLAGSLNPLQADDLSLDVEYGKTFAHQGRQQGGAGQQPDRLYHRDRGRSPAQRLSAWCAARRWLTLNTGDELGAHCRSGASDDIATDNTVASTRIANARITYSGTGSFADASQPGWLDRFFMSPLWPF